MAQSARPAASLSQKATSLGHHTAAALLFSCVILLNPSHCSGALNIGTRATEDLVAQLRQSIFVETAYLSERREERCTSLDGPRCFQFMAGSSGLRGPAADGPGVLPEKLLQDFGVPSHAAMEFYTPDYNSLDIFSKQLDAFVKQGGAQTADAGDVRKARNASEQGFLHFADLRPDVRVPISFSRGLPGQAIATWDGRWLVRDCDLGKSGRGGKLAAGTTSGPLALPSPDVSISPSADPYAPVLSQPSSQQLAAGGDRDVAVVAELTGSLGYLRFSQPVVIRSLFARWAPPAGTPPALIGGRLGLNAVWTTHLVASKLSRTQGWMDVSGNPWQPVDEIAFLAAQGLEIGAIEVAAHGDGLSEDNEKTFMMMVPMSAQEAQSAGLEDNGQPQFMLKLEKLSPAVAPYVASLQEAVDRNLKFNMEKSVRATPSADGSHVPGLLNARSTLALTDQVVQIVANTNQEMFEHHLLEQLADASQYVASPKQAKAAAGSLVLSHQVFDRAFEEKSSSSKLPADLRKEVLQERAEILEALGGWFSGGKGGWHRSTPTTLPRNGTDSALEKYMKAKRWQTKLDLLTTSFLHVATPQVASQAEKTVEELLQQSPQQWTMLQQAVLQQAMQQAHSMGV